MPIGVPLEDLQHDRCLLHVDGEVHVRSATVLDVLDVVEAERAAADVAAPRGLATKSLAHATHQLLAFEFRAQPPRHDHETSDGAVGFHLFVGEVVEEPHATLGEFLDEKADAVHVATQARLITRHDGVERSRLRRIDHSDQRWALLELGAADARVGVDVRWVYVPTARFNPARGFTDLSVEGSSLVFFGRSAGVNSTAHGTDTPSLRRVIRKLAKIDFEQVSEGTNEHSPHGSRQVRTRNIIRGYDFKGTIVPSDGRGSIRFTATRCCTDVGYVLCVVLCGSG